MTVKARPSAQSTANQLLRYTVVGGIAFAVDFGSLYLLADWVGLHYLTAAAIAFLMGLNTNYLLSTSWVFRNRTLQNRWLEFGIFAGIGIVGLGLNELLIWLFTHHVGFHYLISKMISTVVIFLWNFFARKLALFR